MQIKTKKPPKMLVVMSHSRRCHGRDIRDLVIWLPRVVLTADLALSVSRGINCGE